MTLEVEDLKVRQETRFTRDGATQDLIVCTFYLGKHGPFTETFPAAEFTSAAFQARAQQLKTHLGLMGAQ